MITKETLPRYDSWHDLIVSIVVCLFLHIFTECQLLNPCLYIKAVNTNLLTDFLSISGLIDPQRKKNGMLGFNILSKL